VNCAFCKCIFGVAVTEGRVVHEGKIDEVGVIGRRTHDGASMPCATIRTRTVGIITAINSTEDCDFLRSLVDRAARTSVVITNAWMAMNMAIRGGLGNKPYATWPTG
jgi:hypothetical protein